jgi:hypothetical protein
MSTYFVSVLFCRSTQRNERGERRCISIDSSQARKDHPAVKMIPACMLKITLAIVFTFHAQKSTVFASDVSLGVLHSIRVVFSPRICILLLQ